MLKHDEHSNITIPHNVLTMLCNHFTNCINIIGYVMAPFSTFLIYAKLHCISTTFYLKVVVVGITNRHINNFMKLT